MVRWCDQLGWEAWRMSDDAFNTNREKGMVQTYLRGCSSTNSLSSGEVLGARMGISLHLMTITPMGVWLCSL